MKAREGNTQGIELENVSTGQNNRPKLPVKITGKERDK